MKWRYFKVMVLILALALTIGFAGCIDEEEPAVTTPTITPAQTVTEPEPITTPVPTAVESKDIPCLACHTGLEDLDAHKHGGDICNRCHGLNKDVHEIHRGPTTTCTLCHSELPEIPEPIDEHAVCESCHNSPNSLEPSNGNLVNIHMSRGLICTDCHLGDIADVHSGTSGIYRDVE